MFDPEFVAIAISVITLVVVGFWLYKGKSLKDAQASATEVAEVVRAAVFAAEQLKATGQLPDNNAAFNFAYHHAHKLLPGLEKETLEMWIESMVPIANQAINRDGVPSVTPKPTLENELRSRGLN